MIVEFSVLLGNNPMKSVPASIFLSCNCIFRLHLCFRSLLVLNLLHLLPLILPVIFFSGQLATLIVIEFNKRTGALV